MLEPAVAATKCADDRALENGRLAYGGSKAPAGSDVKANDGTVGGGPVRAPNEKVVWADPSDLKDNFVFGLEPVGPAELAKRSRWSRLLLLLPAKVVGERKDKRLDRRVCKAGLWVSNRLNLRVRPRSALLIRIVDRVGEGWDLRLVEGDESEVLARR